MIVKFFLLLLVASPAFAGTHITLQGFVTDNNFGLQTQSSRSASGSFAFDLGRYFRIGMTHRQSYKLREFYEKIENQDAYQRKSEGTYNTSNSLDLTIILYYGRVLVPYFQLGMVKKDYHIETKVLGEKESLSIDMTPVPHSGLGVGIRLNNNFSLKLSYTVSPGVRQNHPDEEPESVLDSFSSIGISYNI